MGPSGVFHLGVFRFETGQSGTIIVNPSDDLIVATGELFSATPRFTLILTRMCRRYHFSHDTAVMVETTGNQIVSTAACAVRLIRQLGAVHYSVNCDLVAGETRIRQTHDFQTTETILPLVGFDLSSCRRIDRQLQQISLLL